MTGDWRGPEQMLANTQMVPRHEAMHNQAEDDAVKPKPKSFCSRCCAICCAVCCGRRKKIDWPDESHREAPDLLRAETQLTNEKHQNLKIEEEIEHWREEVRHLQAQVDHRLQVGRDLGLPVDDMVYKSMHKIKPEPMNLKHRRPAPDAARFDDAQAIVRSCNM